MRMKTPETRSRYAARERIVAEIASLSSIGIEEIQPLDRLGRLVIADKHFAKCTDSAQNMLLNDEHPQISNAARLAAKPKETK